MRPQHESGNQIRNDPILTPSPKTLPLSLSRVISRSQAVSLSDVSPSNENEKMDINCTASPSFEPIAVASHEHDVQSQSFEASQQHPLQMRSSSSKIVAMAICVVVLAAPAIKCCNLGTVAPAYTLKTALESRKVF